MAHPKAGRPGNGAPVKYFAALLIAEGVEADFIGPPHPFDMTDYYSERYGVFTRSSAARYNR